MSGTPVTTILPRILIQAIQPVHIFVAAARETVMYSDAVLMGLGPELKCNKTLFVNLCDFPDGV